MLSRVKGKGLPKDTFKRLFLLYVIDRFKKGVYGKKRLHKIVYAIIRDENLKPFEFKKHYHGQYSENLDEIQDQLLATGHISATPLKTKQVDREGNKFELVDKNLSVYLATFMEKIEPKIRRKVDRIIDKHGYLPEKKLVELAYSFPEFAHVALGDTIFEEKLPDYLPIKDLSEDDLEELEIGLNPLFVIALRRLDEASRRGDFDPKKVKKVVRLI